MGRASFRIRLSAVLALVVVAAAGLAAYRLNRRAIAFRTRSHEHARAEAFWRGLMDSYNAVGKEPVAWKDAGRVFRPAVTYHAQMKEKYDRAARRPWESVKPDPPDPTAE